MGREFLEVFEEWAGSYDESVVGHDKEYEAVFVGYENILDEVAKRAKGTVIEFGVGTGNLTNKLLSRGLTVFGIEPSKPMRDIALKKVACPITDGDFLVFELPSQQVDTIVSTYAFHHLTDEEKYQAIASYGKFLQKGGKIVFADTMFKNQEAYIEMIETAKGKGFTNLANDLQREYYTTIESLRTIFSSNGFSVEFSRCNDFVWLIDATKL
ncbi:class I SAM-dependent methyltransferase [Bacillus timonensis]|nr:class I SAM-dependent methyltransferase [Bacillus timonensis]